MPRLKSDLSPIASWCIRLYGLVILLALLTVEGRCARRARPGL